MKKNNLFVSSKKAALLALLTMSLNNNAKAYSEPPHVMPMEQNSCQLRGNIESKQNKTSDGNLWFWACVAGLGAVTYFIRDFERTKER